MTTLGPDEDLRAEKGDISSRNMVSHKFNGNYNNTVRIVK
jgi:hypothetical protein